MASRIATAKPTLDDIAKMVGQLTAQSGKDCTTVPVVAEALGTTPAVIMTVWSDKDPDDQIISGERGEMWLTEGTDDSAPETPVVQAPKPTTPAQRLKAHKAAAAPAVTPVLDSEGTPITVPVAEGSSERRELDASQGERVISEESVSALVNRINARQSESENPVNNSAITGSWVNEGEPTHFVDYVKGEAVTGHTLLPEPEFIPAPPEGVHPNVWELSQTATTLPARIFWSKRVREQMDAHAEALKVAEAAKAVESPVSDWTAPIDPITGQPFPF